MRPIVVGILATAFATGTLVSGAGQSADAERRLKAAINTEQVDGNLRAAIEQYKALAAGSDRSVAAQALLRMAECHQKLGNAEAQSVYQRVVRDFGDQTAAVAAARERLAGTTPTLGTGIATRQLWGGTGWAPSQITIASDLRTVATFGPQTNDPVTRDLVTGRITAMGLVAPGSLAYVEQPVLSPDLKRVAYTWSGPENGWNYEVRVADVGRSATAVSRGDRHPYVWVRGWSPDGRSLLVANYVDGNSAQIGWLAVADGSFRSIKSGGDGNNTGAIALSPDGRFIALDALTAPRAATREVRVLSADGARESVVVGGPGTNQSPIWSRDGKHVLFTSDREGSFGLWAVPVHDGAAAGPPVRVRSSMGDVSLVGVTGSGSLLYTQTIGSQDVYVADLDESGGRLVGAPRRASDTFLGKNVNPSWSPDGRSVAYLSHRAGSSQPRRGPLVIRTLADGVERVLGTTMFQYGSQPRFSPDGQSVFLTGRNERNSMTVYQVDVASGTTRGLIDTGVFGPPTAALSPDGRTIYVAPQGKLTVYELATGRATRIPSPGTTRGVAASPDGKLVAFVANEDEPPGRHGYVFVANPDGTERRTLFDTVQESEMPWSIAWSADSQFLYVVRGPFDAPSNEVSRIPARGGPPMPTGLTIHGTGPIDVSRDGRRLVYGTGGQPRVEVWALDRFEAALEASR